MIGRRLPVSVLPYAVALAACSQVVPPQNDAATIPDADVVERPTPRPTRSGFPALTELPRGLIGVWTADAAGRCAPGTELRIDVVADRVRFHETEARIVAIEQVDPHSWAINAEATGEGETRRMSFTYNLNEDGSLTRVEAPFPDITYTRCKADR